MKIILKVLLVLALIFLIIAGITALQKFATEPREEYLQGQMEARRVLVAGKIPGRLLNLFVHEGDMVIKDSLVAIVSSRELEAKKLQAEGALGMAKAQSNKAKKGARTEEITALKAMKERAQDAANLAKTTYDRVQKLFNEGVVPLQKRDEAETQMKASMAAATAANAQYEQAIAGARMEDKDAANALVIQARGANAEVDAYLEETKIRAPISGEVSLKLAEEGEIIGAGMPVIAITDLEDSWAVFHIREDFLKNISKGKVFSLQIPALDKTVDMEVFYIASVGDYATWRSSKESGGFDLKSFEIRMRPKTKLENLRPGMSVLFPIEQIQ